MYYLLYGLLYLISLIPFRAIYWLSSFVAWVLDKIVGYRRAVILDNLSRAFPEKDLAEKKEIASKFYVHFTDTFLETIKVLSMSKNTFDERVQFEMDAFTKPLQAGKKMQICSLHAMNWEYGSLAASLHLPVPFLAVYKKILNPSVDRLFKDIRSRFGGVLTETAELGRVMAGYDDLPFCVGLIADQNPGYPSTALWINFFGSPTAFLPGPSIMAKRQDLAVIFTSVIPSSKRGFYTIKNKLITMNGSTLEKGELLRLYRDYVEETIKKNPANYLWSHRRFKHAFREEYLKSYIQD